MPPCYTFNKMCIPESGMELCQGAGAQSSCASTVVWFWALAAAVAIGVVFANGGKS